MSDKLSNATFANVFGSTDSEHLAALYVTCLTDSGDKSAFEREYEVEQMAEAMHKAVSTVIALQQATLGSKRQPNSLNLCATDGVRLVAYRFRNHATSQPPSLYYSTKAGTTLNRKYPDRSDGIEVPGVTDTGKPEGDHGKHLIVASEPSTYRMQDWELIPKNHYVAASPEGKFDVREIAYENGWDAEDAS